MHAAVLRNPPHACSCAQEPPPIFKLLCSGIPHLHTGVYRCPPCLHTAVLRRPPPPAGSSFGTKPSIF